MGAQNSPPSIIDEFGQQGDLREGVNMKRNKKFSNAAKIGYSIELILSALVAAGGFVATIMTIVALHTPFWWITLLAAICTVIGFWIFIDTIKEAVR